MKDKSIIMSKRWSYGWKGFFINDLINVNGYKHYLELGVDRGTTWSNIWCENKTGVDINPDSYFYDNGSGNMNKFAMSTDAFFKQKDPNIKYDIIFIDASHNKEAVKKDFLNSVACLNKWGFIILHDIAPATKKSTSPEASGDTFDFWMSLCDFLDFKNVATCVDYLTRAGDNDAVGIYMPCGSIRDFTSLKNKNYSFSEYQEEITKYVLNLELDALTQWRDRDFDSFYAHHDLSHG